MVVVAGEDHRNVQLGTRSLVLELVEMTERQHHVATLAQQLLVVPEPSQDIQPSQTNSPHH